MCILLLAVKQHRHYPLVVAANREEDYDRPTRAAAFWDDAPGVLAGRDLRQGGTWLGITRAGRFAAVTNFRDSGSHRSGRPSRGRLVSDFLLGMESPQTYASDVARRGGQYNGFSLIVGDGEGLYYYCNREGEARALAPGLYGLSNHLLDTPWPKVVRGKQALAELLATPAGPPVDTLFDLLADRTLPADEELPDTGIGRERERLLSPLFVTAGGYGTRSSTVLYVSQRNIKVSFAERTFDRAPERYTAVEYTFEIDPNARIVPTPPPRGVGSTP